MTRLKHKQYNATSAGPSERASELIKADQAKFLNRIAEICTAHKGYVDAGNGVVLVDTNLYTVKPIMGASRDNA
jgi:hypothetical protein